MFSLFKMCLLECLITYYIIYLKESVGYFQTKYRVNFK